MASSRSEVTAGDIERMRHDRNSDTARLAVAYEFSVGDDGPYTGECFWVPAFCSVSRIAKPVIGGNFISVTPCGSAIAPAIPVSVNTLDGGVARLLGIYDSTSSSGHRD